MSVILEGLRVGSLAQAEVCKKETKKGRMVHYMCIITESDNSTSFIQIIVA